MAKEISMAQLKDLLDIHENTILKIFNEKIDKLEKKLYGMNEENKELKNQIQELKESMDFQKKGTRKQ